MEPIEGRRLASARDGTDGMTGRKRSWLPWSLGVASLATLTVAVIVGIAEHSSDALPAIPVFVAFALVGTVVAANRPGNPIGWLFLADGLGGGIGLAGESYARYGARAGHPLPAANGAGWVFIISVELLFPLVLALLLFPYGRLLSRRWRPVAAFAVVANLLSMGSTALADVNYTKNLRFLRDPARLLPASLVRPVYAASQQVTLIALGAAAVAIVIRFRRSSGEERQQVKWIAYAGAVAVIGLLLAAGLTSEPVIAFVTLVPLLPIAAAVAIFKYRLYDIDVVINKTVVYGLLAAFITAVYVAIVVGLGAALGQGASKPNLGLSIVATAVVAVAFQPVRDRTQRLANRLVYGQRATPYEVLSEFSSRMAQSYAAEDLLPRMARILAEGTGARTAVVWLRVGDQLKPEAAWPPDELPESELTMSGDGLPATGATLALPVEHRGEPLGALTLTKAPGDRLTPSEEHLARDLASGAGLVLRNVRLTEELLARLDELQASRQRLVAAQDQERRRLERNIHDGAQQQLVSLAVKLRLARSLAASDPAAANNLLAQAAAQMTEAQDDLRHLARGIYPPLLADQGLVAALTAQARRAPFPVEVRPDAVGRYPQEQEAAVYFCVLEALQNVSKYSGGSKAVVRLGERDGELTFEVSDDGAGFDTSRTSYGTGLQGMADRLAALGGDLGVRSAPGRGTTVMGRVPARTLEAV